MKLDLDIAHKTNSYLMVSELNRASGEEAVLKAELDRRRALQSHKILSLRDEIDANQNVLNLEREKQSQLVADLSVV